MNRATTPYFSVVIPTFNRLALVQEAVESVLAQTFGDFEVIVVDDGSSDGTIGRLAERFGDRIATLSQRNSGVSTARNLGASHATGSYVAYLDSDDLWEPDKLEVLAEVIQTFEKPPAFLFSDFRRYHIGRGAFWPETNTDLFPRIFDHYTHEVRPGVFSADAPAALRCIVADYPFFPSTFVARRDLHQDVQWDTAVRYSEDFNFVGRIAQRYPMVYVHRPLTTVRMHDSNKSANWRAKFASHMQTLDLLQAGAGDDVVTAVRRAKGRRHFAAAKACAAEGDWRAAFRQCGAALGCPAWYLGALTERCRRGPVRASSRA